MKRPLKKIINRIPFYIGSHLGHVFLHILFATCRLTEKGWEQVENLRKEGNSGLIMFWHFVLTPPFYYLHTRDVIPLIGLHKDAEVLAQIGYRLGYSSLRGSSNRRSEEVTRELIHTLRIPGKTVAMTPDGPRGPARIPKIGSLKVARKCGAFIYPLGVAYTRYRELSSWDSFRAIKPFSGIYFVWGEPFKIPEEMPIEKAVEKVKKALDDAQASAEKMLTL